MPASSHPTHTVPCYASVGVGVPDDPHAPHRPSVRRRGSTPARRLSHKALVGRGALTPPHGFAPYPPVKTCHCRGRIAPAAIRSLTPHKKTSGESRMSFCLYIYQSQTFSLFCRPSFSMAITMPVRANSASALGRTMRLLNISVSSHTKSLPVRVPRKMNTRAIMV